ncbi:MAG: hypothetical protein ACLFN9_23450, partial [Desulfococcaceae bacterium]
QRKKGEKKKLQENHFEFLPKFTGSVKGRRPGRRGVSADSWLRLRFLQMGGACARNAVAFFKPKTVPEAEQCPNPLFRQCKAESKNLATVPTTQFWRKNSQNGSKDPYPTRKC